MDLRAGERVAEDIPDSERTRRYTEALGAVEANLPCSWCRGAEYYAQHLPRLGRHERRILLQASSPDRESVIVAPEGPGRAADEAHRRAIRRLFAAGLLWVGWRRVYVETRTQTKARWEHMAGRWWQTGGQPIRREYRKRAVWRSPLGQALVERLRSQLEAGARIRWSAHRAALVSACRRSTDELLSMFQTEVQQDAERLEALVRTAAAIGARDTCHLEQHRRVCQVLKALREA